MRSRVSTSIICTASRIAPVSVSSRVIDAGLKIDRAFVMKMMQDESCAAIVDIVLHLARRLRLKSVAEGVEDATTLDNLIKMGCDEAQGYYLSRPLSADHIAEFVRSYAGTCEKSAA
jgi:EAL domain-containing protein (putative c-di-GMP-specific phosphodiesterase class I)